MIEDVIAKLCPDAIVSKNCKSVTVLVPEDFDNIQDIMSAAEKDGLEANVEKRTRCEVWSRVMGYLRPTRGWNRGKQSEWMERKTFKQQSAQVTMQM